MSRSAIPYVVIAAILALVAVATVLAVRQYDDSRDAAVNELRTKVVIGAATLSAYFSGDLATLSAIASAQPVIEQDQQRMYAYFRRVAPPGNKLFTAGLGWIDAKGQSRVSSALPASGRRSTSPLAPTSRPSSRRTLRTSVPASPRSGRGSASS